MKITMNKKVIFLPIFVFLIMVFIFPVQKVIALTITPVRLEISGNPGEVVSKEMTLFNESDTAETFFVSYANFEAQGETGNPAFVNAKDDLGTWMQAPYSVSVAPKQSETVLIKITIPNDATPGGHFAAIFWGTVPPNTTSNAVTIGAKTGLLILLRVNGDVNENGGLLEFSTKNNQKFYTALPVSFYYRFQNTGGDRIKPTGDIKMKDIFGITEKKISGNPVDGNILPNSVRKFEIIWEGKDGPVSQDEGNKGGFFSQVRYEWRNFAFGHYNAKMTLAYGTKGEIATGKYGFWVLPWHLLIVIIVLLALAFIIIRKLLISYNKWVIHRAKEMLKLEREKTHEDNTNFT
jgi:hypothetical protein